MLDWSGDEVHLPDFFFKVGAEDDCERLDSFLGRRCEERSRSHFGKLIREGMVLVNGRAVKPGYAVKVGDEIAVRLPAEVPSILSPQPMELDILHEDEEILVLNKAAGVVVHPGAGHGAGTLVHGLLAHCPRLAIQGAPLRPGIVHRLDRDTSGAMVVAKTERAYLDLIRQFKVHNVRKEYLALVYGMFTQPEGEIRTRLGRHLTDRKKMAVSERMGREAASSWHVEKTWGDVSLVRVVIETGRTHQIRVHMSYVNHPVVGDETYGGGKRRAKQVRSIKLRELLGSAERQMLHAWRLAFDHPVTGAPLSFLASLPADFNRLLNSIERVFSPETK